MIDPLAAGRALLPDAGFIEARPLTGGLMNHVWRLIGATSTAILKHAPPFVATDPAIPLSAARLTFEASALELLETMPDLAPGVRPPRLIAFSASTATMLTEDLGDCPDLLTAPHEAGRVGAFIGRLHASTRQRPDLAARFHNRDIQQTRLAVQYAPVADLLAGHPDATELGEAAVRLGERLCRRGCCLVMGDLWPPSVLIAPEGVRLIDWEMSHYGLPAQDVAHLVAHLWMAGQSDVIRDFLDAYGREAGPLTAAERRDCGIHFGAEILVRAVGPFSERGPYRGLSRSDGAVEAAIQVAATAIAGEGDWFAPDMGAG
jgi:hypothetical protein